MKNFILSVLALTSFNSFAQQENPNYLPIPKMMDKAVYLSTDGFIPQENWFNTAVLAVPKTTPRRMFKDQISMKVPTGTKLIVWPGFTKKDGFDFVKPITDLSVQYNAQNKTSGKPYSPIEYIYVYDEIYWGGSGVDFSLHEKEIYASSAYVKNNALKTAVTILPQVILDPQFKPTYLKNIDLIGIDIYPSMPPYYNSYETYGCKFPGNPNNELSNLLYCSTQKLRKMGYRGKIWYLPQAFSSTTWDNKTVYEHFLKQKETILHSERMDIQGILPWGYYLGKYELMGEPNLVPGNALPQQLKNLINFQNIPSSNSYNPTIPSSTNPNVTAWYQQGNNARNYNLNTINNTYNFGNISIFKNGTLTGRYNEQYCFYENKSFRYDNNRQSCLYSDGKWYSKSTPGVSLLTTSYNLSGTVDSIGNLQGSWTHSQNPNSKGFISGKPSSGGLIKGYFNNAAGTSMGEFIAK